MEYSFYTDGRIRAEFHATAPNAWLILTALAGFYSGYLITIFHGSTIVYEGIADTKDCHDTLDREIDR